jgi:hypothetical protein
VNNIFSKAPLLKKVSSILLILVFTLGITPRKTLHTWFANHTDSTAKIPAGNTQQLSKAGFNCQCDDLVAESNFITFSSFVVINISSLHSFVSFSIPPFVSLSLSNNNLRGPPSKV